MGGWLLRLPNRIKDNASSKLTRAETKSGRSYIGSFLDTTSTLSATLFNTEQYIPGRPYISDRTPKYKEEFSRKEVDLITRGL